MNFTENIEAFWCIDSETGRVALLTIQGEDITPYIESIKRPVLDSALIGLTPRDESELNYTITKLIKQYIKRNGVSYKTFNTVMGVLDCAKLELYRTDVSFYEDKKRIENGEVI